MDFTRIAKGYTLATPLDSKPNSGVVLTGRLDVQIEMVVLRVEKRHLEKKHKLDGRLILQIYHKNSS